MRYQTGDVITSSEKCITSADEKSKLPYQNAARDRYTYDIIKATCGDNIIYIVKDKLPDERSNNYKVTIL